MFGIPHPLLYRFSCLPLTLLLCVLSVMLFFAWRPVLRGLVGEDILFYGTVSRVAVSSVWGGTGVPLFDKVHVCINGDETQEFLLVLSGEQKAEMAEWFRWWDPSTGIPTPMEIHAKRAGNGQWLINEIDTEAGYADAGSIRDFQVRACFWAIMLNVLLLFTAYSALREYFAYFRHRPWFAFGEGNRARSV